MQADLRIAPGIQEKLQNTFLYAMGISLRILFSFLDSTLQPSTYSFKKDHFSLSPLSFSILTSSPIVEHRYSYWFWNWMTIARLPHHLMSMGCWSRLMWMFSLTKGSSTILNFAAYRLSELMEGAKMTRQAKAQGILGGSFSPFFFLFWGMASAGLSLNKGSAVKYAMYLLLGLSPEMYFNPFMCGNLDQTTCPLLSWLQNTLLPSFSITWIIPAVGWQMCSSTLSEMMVLGLNTLQQQFCCCSPSRSSESTLANSERVGCRAFLTKKYLLKEVSIANPLSKTLPLTISSLSDRPMTLDFLTQAVWGSISQSQPRWKSTNRSSSLMNSRHMMGFLKGSVRRILCTISPSLLKMQMFSSVGSSSLRVSILVLSEVMAMGPPQLATEMSMYSWLSRLNLFPKVFSVKRSALQQTLPPLNSYQSQSISTM